MSPRRGRFRTRVEGMGLAVHTWICPSCVRTVPRAPGKDAGKTACATCNTKALHFPSKAEARRYVELRILERAGKVRHLKTQPRFPLEVKGFDVGTYIGDFEYEELRGLNWHRVVEDAKPRDARGHDDASTLRRRLAEILHAIIVRLV